MTIEEYNSQINNFVDSLNTGNRESILAELVHFQYAYMENVLKNYKVTINCEIRQYVYNILQYAVYSSTSGNAIEYVPDKDTAEAIEEILWNEFGDYLLDVEIYDNEHGSWAVDCIFGGAYVPEWDGWDEERR